MGEGVTGAASFESGLQKILKTVLLVIVGSGLIGNALYIYGLGYYQGYINRLGFEYSVFPIGLDETLLWAYWASQELGLRAMIVWTNLNDVLVWCVFLGVYVLARAWMIVNKLDGRAYRFGVRMFCRISRGLGRVKNWCPKMFYLVSTVFSWVVIDERSVRAFLASYFFIFVLFITPVFLFVWVYFPVFGFIHGEGVALKRLERYETNRCGNSDDYWDRCIDFSMDHLQVEGVPEVISGRLVLKNGSMIGVLTKAGPVTMSISKNYYHTGAKNACYGKQCGEP